MTDRAGASSGTLSAALRRTLPAGVALLVAAVVARLLVSQSKPAVTTTAPPSEPSDAAKTDSPASPSSFLETVRGTVLSSLPTVSALTFVVVAVKVFRAANMETSTTVAIVSNADVVALLKGVVLTLLPGLLAGIVAATVSWWGASLPTTEEPGAARKALFNARAVLAWSLLVVAFYTISWPVFDALFLPTALMTGWLLGRGWHVGGEHHWRGRRLLAMLLLGTVLAIASVPLPVHGTRVWQWFVLVQLPVTVAVGWVVGRGWVWSGVEWSPRLQAVLPTLGSLAAVGSIGYLTLAPTVWLPLRAITTVPGKTVTVNGTKLPSAFAAFVLSDDKTGVSLLLDTPRAVVSLPPGTVSANPPICIPPIAQNRILLIRASQLFHFDPDHHSPYQVCPGMH